MANAILYNIEALRTATVAARDPNDATGAPDTTEQRIADLIEARFGCHKDQVRELVILLGKDLPEPRKAARQEGAPKLGTLVLYSGTLAVITGHDEDGDARYYCPEDRDSDFIGSGESWSYATDAEIDAFAQA